MLHGLLVLKGGEIMKTRMGVGLVLTALVFFATVTSGHAVLLGFYNITGGSNSGTEGQFSVEVTDYGSNQVLFTLKNALGGVASAIAEVYFDDGSLFGIADILSDSGVNFAQGASPGNLPDHNNISPSFEASAGFLVDAGNGAPTDGVNPGEQLRIVFDLGYGKTFADVIAALALPSPHTTIPEDNWLRIGIHVVAFANGGSESFVNIPVPEPATMLISALGLLGMGAAGRKRIFRKKPA
jgi:hypothetical protein